MLFHEIYGTYYNVLAKILTEAVEGRLTKERLYEIVRNEGFAESVLTIPLALESQTWPLLSGDLTTPLEHVPTMPLTDLQRRWMKTLLLDPRIALFDPPTEELSDVEPLYPRDALVYYDRYQDGDPYDDEGYRQRFRCVLRGIREKRWIRVWFEGNKGKMHIWNCVPYGMEYSQKDDKFRLISANKRTTVSINLARIKKCTLLEPCTEDEYRPLPMKKRILVLELTDERNALERALLHFSHLTKETERLGENRYKLTLYYEREDETELLIRVLSFGPVMKVIFPEDFLGKTKERLEKQKKLRICE